MLSSAPGAISRLLSTFGNHRRPHHPGAPKPDFCAISVRVHQSPKSVHIKLSYYIIASHGGVIHHHGGATAFKGKKLAFIGAHFGNPVAAPAFTHARSICKHEAFVPISRNERSCVATALCNAHYRVYNIVGVNSPGQGFGFLNKPGALVHEIPHHSREAISIRMDSLVVHMRMLGGL